MAAPVSKDQELELSIDSLAYGGNGVARLNGFVVFVRRGLPGDRVEYRGAGLYVNGEKVPWQDEGTTFRDEGGRDYEVFDEQLDVRDMLRAQSATEWLIVSTGMFTSFLFEPAFGVVDLAARRVNALGGWDTQVTVTTPDDIGALTAAILRAEPRLANQVVYVAGDTVSYRQLADTVDRALGIETQRQARTVPALMRELAAAPGDPMRKYRAVFAQGRGVAWDPARTFNAARGIATQGLTAWVRETRQALGRAAGVVA